MQLLQTMLPAETPEAHAQGVSAENVQKNRFPHIVPSLWLYLHVCYSIQIRISVLQWIFYCCRWI